MKSIRIVAPLVLLILLCGSLSAQPRGRRHAGHPHGRKVVVVKRSPYRPAKVIVYHPHWRPAYACHRRWVFFPRYNLYWDNWRNQYVFWNGAGWISQAARPAVIVNVNLENEKTAELKEDEDDEDDIYKSNADHKNEYKAD